ncbi:tyrosyl-dna phosphodiesterase 1 [Holotrichia oblita]|uniref:Tyrosyl-dna phosphodiesterase 1 n=1 Tax=Holotrichia oblita TaxID=644536 RepID=A0ACB9SLQ1_HOLOL|nr:tyrosyl-dna phosphodiesterase 1 [Holotrichia oblita]
METTSASTSKIISRNFEETIVEKSNKPGRVKSRVLRITTLFILAIILVLNNALYTLFIPLVIREYKIVSNNDMLYYYGLMYASKDIALLISSPLIGGLIDRVGYDDPLVGGIGFILVSTIIFAFGDSYWLFFTNRVFQGLTSIMTDTSIMVVIAALFTRDENRIYAFGALLGCSTLGFLIMSPFVDILVTNLLNDRILFLGFDAAYVGISLIAFCLLKWYNFAEMSVGRKVETKQDLVPMWKLLIDPYILICAGALAMSQVLPSFFQYVLPFWSGYAILLSNEKLSCILGLSAHLSGIIMAVLVANTYPNRRWLIIASGLTLEGICGLILPFVTSYVPLMDNKRKEGPTTSNDSKRTKKEACPHAEKCFRRNPHHFREYDHVHLKNFMEQGPDFKLPPGFPQERQIIVEQLEILKSVLKIGENMNGNNNKESIIKPIAIRAEPSSTSSSSKKIQKSTSFKPSSDVKLCNSKSMASKLEKNAPYNIFFTQVPKAIETMNQDNTITFTDLLCPSLGELQASLQFNFMIDVMWLIEQYQARGVHKIPLTILYGYEFPDMEKYMSKFLPNVTYHLVKMKDPFGTHHSKMGLYAYADGSLRVVVSTANLYYEDWNHYNQGLWISPACPALPGGSSERDGESSTKFKSTLLKYLQTYNLACLKGWTEHVKKTDFSQIKVFLVTSVPGKHFPQNDGSHIHRVANILSKHCTLPSKTTPQSEGPLAWCINAQASTIGSLGKAPAEWLRSVMLRTLSCHKQGQPTANSQATLNIIYPTVDNVMKSYFGAEGGGCLPYAKNINEKQKWLKDYLHEWRADVTHRTRVMPHIKTYCRVSPCLTKLAWFLLTSANISKAAWGGNIQRDSSVYVRSNEVGVMFMPSLFDEDYFVIRKECVPEGGHVFPFIYDMPLMSYKPADYPWCN